MSLRKNRFLKFLAILLFSLEIFSPALVFSATTFQEDEKTSISQSHSQSIVLSLLIEEISNESERDGKDDKDGFLLALYDFPESFQNVVPSYGKLYIVNDSFRQIISERPSIYTLNCTFII